MSRNEPLIEIDSARLNKRIQDIAAIGSTLNGGSNRQALTDEDAEARNLFMSWCENSACEVRVDSMGNIFARRSGSNPNADPILIGSHLDTQPTGGRFDGV
jgi:N-carbamoyl-L-amino-acid hydrolase